MTYGLGGNNFGLGTTYGAGDGSTTFNLPDLRDRLAVGAGGNTALAANDGVSAANRHATRHRHTPHNHEIMTGYGGYPGAAANNSGGYWETQTADGGSNISSDPLDGPAYLGLNYLIKT